MAPTQDGCHRPPWLVSNQTVGAERQMSFVCAVCPAGAPAVCLCERAVPTMLGSSVFFCVLCQ